VVEPSVSPPGFGYQQRSLSDYETHVMQTDHFRSYVYCLPMMKIWWRSVQYILKLFSLKSL